MVKEIARRGILFSVVGPSGSGKSTLGQRLLKHVAGNISLSVSVTSREPRGGEVDGEHYYFVSSKEFEAMRDRGEFFEWEQTHGNYYGTVLKTLEESIQSGRDLLLDVDIRGALTFKERFPNDAVSVFLLPPSPQELVSRIRNRAQITEEEVQKRLRTAEDEYQLFLKGCAPSTPDHIGIDYFLVNDDINVAFEALLNIYLSESRKVARYEESVLKPYCTTPSASS